MVQNNGKIGLLQGLRAWSSLANLSLSGCCSPHCSKIVLFWTVCDKIGQLCTQQNYFLQLFFIIHFKFCTQECFCFKFWSILQIVGVLEILRCKNRAKLPQCKPNILKISPFFFNGQFCLNHKAYKLDKPSCKIYIKRILKVRSAMNLCNK